LTATDKNCGGKQKKGRIEVKSIGTGGNHFFSKIPTRENKQEKNTGKVGKGGGGGGLQEACQGFAKKRPVKRKGGGELQDVSGIGKKHSKKKEKPAKAGKTIEL